MCASRANASLESPSLSNIFTIIYQQRDLKLKKIMSKPLVNPQSSRRRPQVVTARGGTSRAEPIYDLYAQCLCDLPNSDNESPQPPEWFVTLYHENGQTSSHRPKCSQVRIAHSKTSTKGGNPPLGVASYLDLEEEEPDFKADRRKQNARRHRKEAKRTRGAKEKAEAMKAVKPSLKLIAQCSCYDALSDPEDEVGREEARNVRHTHTDETITFHLPTCVLNGSNCTIPFKRYIDLERKKKMEKQEKREHNRRQSKEAKRLLEVSEPNTRVEPVGVHSECSCDLYDNDDYSWTRRRQAVQENGTNSYHLMDCDKIATLPRTSLPNGTNLAKSESYIDLEGEEEEEEAGPTSPAAKQYDPRTIASDFLRVIGKHPYLPPLNAHMKGFSTKRLDRASR